jgi:O-antigen ligase
MIGLILIGLLVYVLYFFWDTKKALLLMFLLKLPIDQLLWQITIPFPFINLKGTEFITVTVTFLCIISMMKKSFKPNFLGFSFMLYLFIYLIQIFREPHIVWGFRLFFHMTTGICIGIVVAQNFRNIPDIIQLLKMVLFSSVIVTLLDIPAIFSGGELQVYVASDDYTIGTYLSGGVGNYFSADSFAHALIVTVPGVLLASTYLTQKWQKALCIYVIIFSVIGVFCSALRAGWISLSVILLFWVATNRRKDLMIVAVSLIFIISSFQVFDKPLQTAYMKIDKEVEGFKSGYFAPNSFGGRLRIWGAYMDYYINSPMASKFIGSNGYLKIGYMLKHDPHNDFIHIILRMGFIGLLFTLLLYWKMYLKLRGLWKNKENMFLSSLAFTSILILIAMMIASSSRAGLINPNYQWFFWSFCLMSINMFYKEKNEGKEIVPSNIAIQNER